MHFCISLPNMVRVIKLWKRGRVAHVWERLKKSYKSLVGNREEKGPLGRCTREDNIKMAFTVR